MSKEPNRNVYVGHRYVPKIMGEWDKTIKYEGLSIVIHEGNSYTSKTFVPVGIDIQNEEFWVITGNYNVQVENYRNEVKLLGDEVNELRIYVDGEVVDLKTFVNENMTQFEQEMDLKHDSLITEVNNNINDFKNEVNEVNEEQTKNIRDISVTPLMFGAKGDGVSDDTQALQDTINYCIEEGLILHSHPDKVYKTNGNIITGYLNMSGVLNLTALTTNQEHVLRIESRINSTGELTIDGDYKAKHGIIGTKFGRSKFYRTEILKCKVWGMIYLPSGNNNFVTHDFLRGRLNGYREEITLSKISSTSNVNTSILGYGTYEMINILDDIYKEENTTYFIMYNGEAYKIRDIDGIKLNIINFDAGEDGDLISATIVSGGAVNIPKHGDNGVGTFNGLDVISNRGVGINMSSLYAHNLNNLVAQGNGIGLSCDDYTLGMTLNSPYFEINQIDAVVWNYITGVMTRGIFHVDRFQSLTGRVLGEFIGIKRMKIISNEVGTLTSSVKPSHNNAQSMEAIPGFVNNYSSSASGDFSAIIDNEKTHDGNNNYTAILNLTFINLTHGRNLNISLKNNNGDTIEGSEGEYTHPHKITGTNMVIISKTNNNWRVNVLSENKFTNVGYPPVYVGQIAVSNGIAYVSTGIETKEDWKPITT